MWEDIDPQTASFNEIVSRQGALNCFCDADRKAEPDALYEVRDNEGKKVEYPICKKWAADTSSIGFFAALTQLAAFFVVLTGFILRTIYIKLVLFTKQNRNSKIATLTMYSILVSSFFNAGILYIMAPWNFVEQGVKDDDFLSGIYTDFTAEWFQAIGSMIAQTTAISLVFP